MDGVVWAHDVPNVRIADTASEGGRVEPDSEYVVVAEDSNKDDELQKRSCEAEQRARCRRGLVRRDCRDNESVTGSSVDASSTKGRYLGHVAL